MADEADSTGKYKGLRGYARQQGLGRLRRANSKPATRIGGWERGSEDDDFLERHGELGRRSHSGEGLLAKFNRLARDSASGDGGPGEICGFSGASILVRAGDVGDAGETPCQVRQLLKKQIKGVKNPLCVGDQVRVVVAADGSGVITAVAPRRNQLARSDSHNKALLHVCAANLDCLVVVAAVTQPELKTGFIDRYLLIAAANAIAAVVVINKCDLADAAAVAAVYRAIGHPVFVTNARDGNGEVDALRAHLRGRSTVVAGQSGVGKSSLVNRLFPGFAAKVGAVSTTGGLGRQTTTAGRSYLLPDGGRLVDTPGIRECGISGLTAVDVALLYPDLAAHHHRCKFTDCTHLHEPDCAVLAAVAAGGIARSRYDSYRSIVLEDLADGRIAQ